MARVDVQVFECERDQPLVSIPRAEIHIVVRFGPCARGGIDAYAFGARQTAHRKVIRAGQRSLTARLRLGATEAVLGTPASAIAGRIVALEDLWGEAATAQLLERLAGARGMVEGAAVLEGAIAERLATAAPPSVTSRLAIDAAARLANDNVSAVAADLGVSDRHLRRVFREAVGVSPKEFGKLARFHRALRAARAPHPPSWASIARRRRLLRSGPHDRRVPGDRGRHAARAARRARRPRSASGAPACSATKRRALASYASCPSSPRSRVSSAPDP